MKRPGAKALAPVVILVAGILLVVVVHATREDSVTRPPPDAAPLVRAVTAEPRSFQFRVTAHGTVKPRSESDLVPQVSGEVVWISPDLATGGFFEAGQPLVRIERADYEAALESARANVARAESEYARAKKELGRQRRLADRSVASEARIDDAENAYKVAEATLRERRAQLERAERDLQRTELTAPYKGRVRSEQVDVGQFASRGVALARLYAVDYAEVRLPLPDRELAYLDLALSLPQADPQAADPEDAAAGADAAENGHPPLGPPVHLHAEFAGQRYAWTGRIVRTEGELDPKSRMVQVVARVEDPYGASAREAGQAPLTVGLFVEAEIEGRWVEDAYVLPRNALRRMRGEEGSYVLVIDDDSRLRMRDVEVLRSEPGRIVVGKGLRPGDRICVSPLRVVTDGMRVRVAGDAGEGEEIAGAGS
jgi:RND family efflux transporter MFP subunit